MGSKYPKLVCIVDSDGIETTKIVAQSMNEQMEGEELLEKILPALEDINTLFGGRRREDGWDRNNRD